MSKKRAAEITAGKQPGLRGRPFAPGQSGNPAGRPVGSRNEVTILCEYLLAGDAEAIVNKAIEQAKEGDPAALRLCIERLIPARAARDRSVSFHLPDVARAVDVAEAAAAVIAHAASGDITLSEAKEFMALLEGQRRVIETADLAVRLELLEGRLAADGPARPMGFVPEELAARVRRLDRATE